MDLPMKLRRFFPHLLFVVCLVFSLACETSMDGKILECDVRYYRSGALQWRRTYVQGVKDGVHEGWWENGQKKFEYHFVQGNYDGDVKEWHPSGAPSLLMHYRDGVETGLQRAWRENGTLYANYEARDGNQYGVVNSRLCYSVKDGEGAFHSAR